MRKTKANPFQVSLGWLLLKDKTSFTSYSAFETNIIWGVQAFGYSVA